MKAVDEERLLGNDSTDSAAPKGQPGQNLVFSTIFYGHGVGCVPTGVQAIRRASMNATERQVVVSCREACLLVRSGPMILNP